MKDLVSVAHAIKVELDKHFGDVEAGPPYTRQVLALAEEVGEFVGAFRRHANMARRTGSFAEVKEELADVIITAYITAEYLNIDIDTEIDKKIVKLFERGWKDIDGL